jgi:hypothetical protein
MFGELFDSKRKGRMPLIVHEMSHCKKVESTAILDCLQRVGRMAQEGWLGQFECDILGVKVSLLLLIFGLRLSSDSASYIHVESFGSVDTLALTRRIWFGETLKHVSTSFSGLTAFRGEVGGNELASDATRSTKSQQFDSSVDERAQFQGKAERRFRNDQESETHLTFGLLALNLCTAGGFASGARYIDVAFIFAGHCIKLNEAQKSQPLSQLSHGQEYLPPVGVGVRSLAHASSSVTCEPESYALPQRLPIRLGGSPIQILGTYTNNEPLK